MNISTEKLYDEASSNWQRTAPILLSDFTARPFLREWCEPVADKAVLDLGCGEGYFARGLKSQGARHIVGIDISAEMIRGATEREASEQLGIDYRTGSATDLKAIDNDAFDLCVAVFLFNYLDLEATRHTMREVHRILRPGGRFVFAVPHPSLAFLGDNVEPFYFDAQDKGYFSGRDNQFEGRIWRRDGHAVPVRSVHKTVEDYFAAMRDAGFDKMPEVAELRATEEHLRVAPDWFGPLRDKPLHLAVKLTV
ncbi:MAG: class I SAM-dependent methyltransferase [Planctomycetota bacterium]